MTRGYITRRATAPALLSAAWWLATAAALAQSATAGLEQDATRPGGTIVVTASRSGEGIDRDLLGSSVTVIDPQALEDRQTRIVSDVLRDVPGVAVSRTGAVGGLTEVRLRGTEGNHVLVIIDGIKADDPYQGGYDFGTLPADDAARIEVLRGQQSSLYGSDAIGGVITYTTLSGRDLPGVRLRAEGGSFGTGGGAARIAGVAGDLDFALSGTAQHDGGYPVAVGGTRDVSATLAGVTGKTIWSPSSAFKLIAVGRYNYTRADGDDFGPNAAIPPVGGLPLLGAVDAPGDHSVNRAAAGLLRAELQSLGGAMTTAASAQIADTVRDGTTAGALSSGDHGQRQRYALENSVRLGDGAIRHRLTIALDAEREAFRNSFAAVDTDTGRHLLHTYGLVGQYDLTIGARFGFGASLRHDWNALFKDDTTWHVDASYLLPQGTRLHGAAGSGIKTPGPFELFAYDSGRYIGNPALRPERSTGWEAGVDQSLLTGRARLGATYFDSRLRDEIQTVYLPPDYAATSVNAATATTQRGVETFAALTLTEVRLDASYTYLHAPQIRNVLATPLAAFPTAVSAQAVRRPRNIASLNVTYRPHAAPVSTTVTLRYNGRQKDIAYTPDFQTLFVDLRAYLLVNLAMIYDLTPHLQLYARVENMLDRRYQEVFGYRASGRAGYGGARLRF